MRKNSMDCFCLSEGVAFFQKQTRNQNHEIKRRHDGGVNRY